MIGSSMLFSGETNSVEYPAGVLMHHGVLNFSAADPANGEPGNCAGGWVSTIFCGDSTTRSSPASLICTFTVAVSGMMYPAVIASRNGMHRLTVSNCPLLAGISRNHSGVIRDAGYGCGICPN